MGRLETEKAQIPLLVCVEPAQIPIKGIFPACALPRVEPSARQFSQVTSQCSHTHQTLSQRVYRACEF